MKIKDLCSDELPREKMLQKGASSLTNAELFAILLRNGDGERNVVELCRDLLKQADQSLCQLSDWSVDRLEEIKGIGPAKALTINAVFEIARRWFSENTTNGRIRITDSSKAYSCIAPRLKSLSHEECWILLLNRSSELICSEKISTGGLTQTTMDSRTVVKKALDKHATAVILVHNHPSGNPQPGKADIECTEILRNALTSFDIKLFDHLVICDNCWFSFADEEIHRTTNLCADGL